MPTCNCPGEALVGLLAGYNGDRTGQTERIAIHNVYRRSGLVDGYITLARLAFEWECRGNCRIQTRFSITPPPRLVQNPATGIWTATLNNAKLRVWVVCVRPQPSG